MSLITKSPQEQQNSKVGTAIGELNCQKSVPIFPVRYSVEPSSKGSGQSFSSLTSALDRNLPKLEHAEYVLRTLRPETYVYIYNENANIQLTCFFYSKIYKGTGTAHFYYLFNGGDKFVTLPAAHEYIWVDCNKTKTYSTDIKIGYTDAPPSKRTWENLLSNKDQLRDKLLPTTVSVKKWEDAVKNAGAADIHNFFPDTNDPKIQNTFFPSKLALQTHILDSYHTDLDWSEIKRHRPSIASIKSGMRITSDDIQIAVALYDPIGLTSELNNIVAQKYNAFQAYVDKNNHAVTSANTLIKFFEKQQSGQSYDVRLKAETSRSLEVRRIQTKISTAGKIDVSPAAIAMRTREKMDEEVVNYSNQLRESPEGLKNYINEYKQTLEKSDLELISSTKDAMAWAPSIAPSLITLAMHPNLRSSQTINEALMFYDRVMFADETYDDEDYRSNWVAYNYAIYSVLGSLPMIKQGQQMLGELIAGDIEENPYWLALAKADSKTWENQKKLSGGIDGIYGVLIAAVAENKLSNAKVEFATRNLILLMNSCMDYWYQQKELIKYRLRIFITESEFPNLFKSTPKENQFTQKKPFRKQIQAFNKRQARRIRAFANPKMYSPLVAVVTVYSLIEFRETYADYNTGEHDEGEYETASAISSGLGVTSAVSIMAGVAIEMIDKDGKIDTALERVFGKRISTAKLLGGFGGVIGGLSALFGAAKDALTSFNLFKRGDNDSAAYTVATSVAGLLNAGAITALGIIGISEAFGTGLLGAVALEGAAYTIIGLTAFAWATLGLGFFVGVLVLACLAAEATDKSLEIWLQQTYWGKSPRYKNNIEEIDAMNGLMYRPHVKAEWDDRMNGIYFKLGWEGGKSIGDIYANSADELILTISLPYYIDGKSSFELIENVRLEGKKIDKVSDRYEVNKRDNKAYSMNKKLLEQTESYSIYEVRLILDDDAKANIKLVYYPNKIDFPKIKISGHPKDKEWQFSNDGVFTDTIDSDELNTLIDDQR